MDELVAADELSEVTQLFGQREQDFILVVDGIGQEWNEFGSRAFDAERQRDRRQLLDAVESQLDVLVAKFVDEDGDRVERVVAARLITGRHVN